VNIVVTDKRPFKAIKPLEWFPTARGLVEGVICGRATPGPERPRETVDRLLCHDPQRLSPASRRADQKSRRGDSPFPAARTTQASESENPYYIPPPPAAAAVPATKSEPCGDRHVAALSGGSRSRSVVRRFLAPRPLFGSAWAQTGGSASVQSCSTQPIQLSPIQLSQARPASGAVTVPEASDFITRLAERAIEGLTDKNLPLAERISAFVSS